MKLPEIHDLLWPEVTGDTVQVVGWDKDSTLARTTQRRWMIAEVLADRMSWPDYARACGADEPVEAARRLMQMLSADYRNVVMSGATDCPEAREWLVRHRFSCYDAIMRCLETDPDTDNDELKIRWIRELQRRGYVFRLFVEDFPPVAKRIEQETGIPVLVLNPCYEDEVAAMMAARGGKIIV